MANVDLQLVEKIRRQDKSGFIQVRNQMFYYIHNYVLKNGGRNDEAEDLFQDSLIALWQNIDSGKYQHSDDRKLMNYFISICKYKWLDKMKSDKSKYTESLSEEWPGNEMIDESDWKNNEEEFEEKWNLFRQLEEKCQQLLSLFYIEEKSFKEISIHYGWTEDTAKNNKYRCLEKIKKLINQKNAKLSR